MTHERIDPTASIGAVCLAVSDLERSIRFYREALGLKVHARSGSTAHLGTGSVDSAGSGDRGRRSWLRLEEAPGGSRPRRATGLYHFAVLVPTRSDLATALARLSVSRAPLQGASDHGVSEALYLSDPDGNGIEIYRDRPRADWPRAADGSVFMPSDPLDLEELLGTASGGGLRDRDLQALPAARESTTVGHVHLHVADLLEAERFYVDLLGFDVVTRYGTEALFVAAGGYHHHVGLNTWAGKGAPPPPSGSTGLRWFSIEHSNEAERERTVARVRAAGRAVERVEQDYLVRDPSENGVRLSVRA